MNVDLQKRINILSYYMIPTQPDLKTQTMQETDKKSHV